MPNKKTNKKNKKKTKKNNNKNKKTNKTTRTAAVEITVAYREVGTPNTLPAGIGITHYRKLSLLVGVTSCIRGEEVLFSCLFHFNGFARNLNLAPLYRFIGL